MKKAAAIVLATLLALGAACSGEPGSGGRPRIVAAFYPVAMAAERIAGAQADIFNATPPGADPHVWLDPALMAAMSRKVGDALASALPAAASTIRANTATLVEDLDALDMEFRRGLSHCARHEIVTSHAAFAYLAARYGLRQIA